MHKTYILKQKILKSQQAHEIANTKTREIKEQFNLLYDEKKEKEREREKSVEKRKEKTRLEISRSTREHKSKHKI